ncbi:DUF499 domain-containing protein [Actinomadura fulvescens]|uniref:ATP-binding protein n=1 Tax=Actinomadura fulvescens TaxID=46160 RepID=A0ABN3Q767_9ACTN
MGQLASVRTTCEPRQDVLEGRLTDHHYAASLDKIVRDRENYAIYGDADAFFELSYPTAGLRRLLARVFGRLGGASGENGAFGVIRTETSFGGGKTHGLIAVHHLARGARPSGVEDFVDPTLLPAEPVQIAGIVGDALDPVNGLTTFGRHSRTLWGEMAAQLGEHAHATLRDSDATRTAPGTATIREALASRPTIVIIDEIAHHLRQLAKSGDEVVRRSAAQIPVFLKNLFEVAMADPNLVVVLTLASSHDAYGAETDEISELLAEATAVFGETLRETHSVLERSGRPLRPAEDEEIGEILKRRLFVRTDPAAAQAAGLAYKKLYQGIGNAELAGGAADPVTYGRLVERTYPFHPELIRVLDKRLGDIPGFNRARGSIKLLAEIVRALWNDPAAPDTEIINVAEIDYSNATVRDQLTVGLSRAPFAQVAEVDLGGPTSHAAVVDSLRFAGRSPYATRTCRTILTHSLEGKQGVGATRSDFLLGTLRSDDDPAFLDEALSAAEKRCWHLDFDTIRWRFTTVANVNRIVEDEKRGVRNTAVADAVNEVVQRTYKSDMGVQVVPFPEVPAQLKDATELRLAVIHHNLLSVGTDDTTTPPLLTELLEQVGASGAFRRNRNTVVFVVADAAAVESLKDRVKTRLALETLARDDRLAGFEEATRAKIIKMRDQTPLEERVAVTRCYKYLYHPADDQARGFLRRLALPAEAQGETKPATRSVIGLLQDEGKIRATAMPYAWLREKTWANRAATTTAEIAAWFQRDHGAPILLDVTLLKDAIRNGVRNDNWVYFDVAEGKAYTASGATPNVEISDQAEVMTLDEATSRGLLVREPTLADLREVITGPRHTATEVRTALEGRIGGEPTKGKVLELLATAVGNNRHEWIVVVDTEPVEGVTALTPTQIRDRGLSLLTVLNRQEADRLGVTVPGRIRTMTPEEHGRAGMALQQLADKIADLGKPVTALTVIGYAREQSGMTDISLLVMALAQLPRQQVSVNAELRAELPGLQGYFELQVSGERASYQALNTKLSGLLDYATSIAGDLRLDIAFTEEITVDSSEWQQTHTVLKNLDPKDVTVRATLGS